MVVAVRFNLQRVNRLRAYHSCSREADHAQRCLTHAHVFRFLHISFMLYHPLASSPMSFTAVISSLFLFPSTFPRSNPYARMVYHHQLP
jgi:hypothetical protein